MHLLNQKKKNFTWIYYGNVFDRNAQYYNDRYYNNQYYNNNQRRFYASKNIKDPSMLDNENITNSQCNTAVNEPNGSYNNTKWT